MFTVPVFTFTLEDCIVSLAETRTQLAEVVLGWRFENKSAVSCDQAHILQPVDSSAAHFKAVHLCSRCGYFAFTTSDNMTLSLRLPQLFFLFNVEVKTDTILSKRNQTRTT